jgi:hypothetical protein
MVRISIVLLIVVSGLLIPTSCISGEHGAPSTVEWEKPYRGFIIGSYWQQWPIWTSQEYLEPKIFFIGIHQYDGPQCTHYYRFEIHFFLGRQTSLIVETFRGIQKTHFLCGFCCFSFGPSYTTLDYFTGEMRGLVVQIPGQKDIYGLIALHVQGTGLYFSSDLKFVHKPLSDWLRPNHYIEITEFTGTRTPFFISGTGSFYYYYTLT